MAEYWWSARRAALKLWPTLALPELAPPGFAQLRPLIHKGWEMVLMAAELSRSDLDLPALVANYAAALPAALARWGCAQEPLQAVLEQVRAEAAASADVVLPVTVWGEQQGTTTNLEGRVQRVGRRIAPEGSPMPDWRIAAELALRLAAGSAFGELSTSRVWGNPFDNAGDRDAISLVAGWQF